MRPQYDTVYKVLFIKYDMLTVIIMVLTMMIHHNIGIAVALTNLCYSMHNIN